MEKKFESDFKCHPLTKEQQDEAFRAFDRQQQKSLERLAQMIESDPKLRAQHEAARRHEHLQKFGSLDFSKLEDRVMANAVMGSMSSPRSNIEEPFGTFEHSSGIVRGVVQRYPRMSDNLPRDGRIKVDVAPGKRVMQTDIYAGNVKTEDLGDALAAFAYGLSGEQLGVIPAESGGGQSTPEHLPLHYLHSERGPIVDFKTTGDPKGPQPIGRALRVRRDSVWSAGRRDRAATSASDRKKLRAKTRAQKKARRKQR
ncbi:hypothetical protein HOU09_gp035 [Dickeya phage vB_DsoM_AD1]|uniref:Uncharacterized protein n=1 Tax=Dickeya phage vB_DsoM_AD1 TaxID=2283029 RepID=A0A384ZXY1_9CAUD|nr:hypothetical protein HOU09_gp035 [Dickeya phage vB_DsoM_AD1]AXG67079.1 hypothetical protein AD1_035 [Dickeya phage vB_DsoM_AD1]